MLVTLVDRMGDDLSIANAARVSFAKWRDELDEKDKRLIRYLARHGHWTPFAHVQLTLRVKAPIFVARQLGKHQVGLVWNEVSRRYVDDTPEFYFPPAWRKRADNVKQGSSDEIIDVGLAPNSAVQHALNIYQELLGKGVAPEMARMILPQNMMTQWVWTGSLMAFARVASLRLDPHTQVETQLIAEAISDICARCFPVAWDALRDPAAPQHASAKGTPA